MEAMVDRAFWHNKRVLVTGHNGFKGSWLTLWLTSMGAQVYGISLENPHPDAHFHRVAMTGLTQHHCDIRDAQALTARILESEAEIVFHLAAQPLVNHAYRDPNYTWQCNVSGSANVLEALRQLPSLKTVVVITTDKVYRHEKDKVVAFTEQDALGGHDPYSASKAMTELLCASYRDSYFRPSGVALATARAGNVIGGGDWAEERLIPDYYRARQQNQPLALRYPQAVRPWQHVLESVRGYLLYAEYLHHHPVDYPVALNFGPRESDQLTTHDLIAALNQLAAETPQAVETVAAHYHESPHLYLDSTLADRTLGWRSALSISDTLRLTHAWYQHASQQRDMRAFSLQQLNDYQQLTSDQ